MNNHVRRNEIKRLAKRRNRLNRGTQGGRGWTIGYRQRKNKRRWWR